VFEDHLTLAQEGDLDADLIRNVDTDIVLLTSYGIFRGYEGVRKAAADDYTVRTRPSRRRAVPVSFIPSRYLTAPGRRWSGS
jgi:hypothetical protein